MPNHVASHSENREKVCAPCGNKVNFKKKGVKYFKINEQCEKLVKKFIDAKYSASDERYPNSICDTCKITVMEYDKSICKRPLPNMPNYEIIKLKKRTRARKRDNDIVCNCFICVIARSISQPKLKKGRAKKRCFNKEINSFNGEFGAYTSKTNLNVCDERNIENPDDSVIKLCKNCFSELSKGLPHDCRSRGKQKNIVGNVMKIMDRIPEKLQDEVVTALLKRKTDSNNNATLELSNMQGRKTKVIINPAERKERNFTEEDLDNFQLSTGSSCNKMKKLTKLIRSTSGKNSVPNYYENHMAEKGKTLDDIYHSATYEFDTDKGKKKMPIVWADAEELVEAVLRERNLVGNHVIKIMADGGQNFFKICATILPENYEGLNDESSDLDTDFEPQEKKSDTLKLTSVHRVIMICIVPNVKETYDNLELMFDLTKLNRLSFKFVSDFKLLLIVNGQQTATATFPCPYCFTTLDALRKSDSETQFYQLKTYGDLKRDYEKFCNLNKNKKLAKECGSTVNFPLFEENDEIFVLEKCIPPELHLMMGLVNTLFWQGLVPLLGREIALLWPQKLKLCSKGYHGDTFEGNGCRTLLKNSDVLLNIPEIYEKVGKLALLPFISSLKAMNQIVDASFSTKKADPNLEKYVDHLRKVFPATGLTKTLKIHVILDHLLDGINFLNGNGLGIWSEQTGESIHREFLKFWQKYQINVIDEIDYPKHLLKAVVEFSSRHI